MDTQNVGEGRVGMKLQRTVRSPLFPCRIDVSEVWTTLVGVLAGVNN